MKNEVVLLMWRSYQYLQNLIQNKGITNKINNYLLEIILNGQQIKTYLNPNLNIQLNKIFVIFLEIIQVCQKQFGSMSK
jgi:hypothetical protein